MNIHISASELAVLTNHNQYRDKKELYIKYWKKYWKQDYDKIVKKLENSNKKPVLPETSSQTISRMAKEHNIPRETISKLYSASKSKNTNEMLKVKDEAVKSSLEKIPKKNQAEFLKQANSLAFTCFGTKNETSALDVYCDKMNFDVSTTNEYFHNDIFIIEEFDNQPDVWSIGGKIDGLIDSNNNETINEDIILEIKNRMRGLFNSLRDYEKVQCFAYMFILDKKCVHLAEYYKSSQSSQSNQSDSMNIIEVPWQDNFWYNQVVNKLSAFVDDFYLFLKSEDRKIAILS